MEWEFYIITAVIIAQTLARQSNLLRSQEFEGFAKAFGAYSQSAMFIARIVALQEDRKKGLNFLKQLILNHTDIEYALELLRWLRAVNGNDKIIFNEEQLNVVSMAIVQQAIIVAHARPLSIVYPDLAFQILSIWQQADHNSFKKYIEVLFETYEDCYIHILNALSSKIGNGGHREYQSNINLDQYNYITGLIDEDLIRSQIVAKYTKEELRKNIEWEEHNGPYQTEINMAKQFMYWYDKKHTEPISENLSH